MRITGGGTKRGPGQNSVLDGIEELLGREVIVLPVFVGLKRATMSSRPLR